MLLHAYTVFAHVCMNVLKNLTFYDFKKDHLWNRNYMSLFPELFNIL